MRGFRSIRARFTGWYLVVLALLLVAMSLGTYLYLRHTLYASLDESLIRRSNELFRQTDLERQLASARYEAPLGEVIALFVPRDGGFTVFSTRTLQQTIDDEWLETAAQGTSLFATLDRGTPKPVRVYLTVYRPVRLPTASDSQPSEPSTLAVLLVGRPIDVITSTLGALRTTLAIAVPLALLLSAGGGLFLVRRALRPVDRMIATARQIEEKDLSERIDVQSHDELGRLATTLNAMLERLERAFRRQRQFTDDASHDLRAPLSVIEAEATLALRRERSPEDYRDALTTIAEEAHGMSQLIEQLLTLARADADAAAPTEGSVGEILRLNAVAGEVVIAMQPLASDSRVTLNFRPAATDVAVRGRAAELRRLISNLIDNAIRYTPDGGRVDVSVAQEKSEAILVVSDTGVGIEPQHVPHVFERFYRVDVARSRTPLETEDPTVRPATGLGLAICKAIVEGHGGRIDVASRPGEGSSFTVRLPRVEGPESTEA
jgi:heavy metal sensor kinase